MAFISLNSYPSPELWLQQEPETMSPKPQPTGRCPHLLDSVIEQRSACLCLLNAGIEGVHHHTCGYFQFIGLPVVFGVIWLKIMHTDILITGETGPVSSSPLRLAASSSGRDIFILCASSLLFVEFHFIFLCSSPLIPSPIPVGGSVLNLREQFRLSCADQTPP